MKLTKGRGLRKKFESMKYDLSRQESDLIQQDVLLKMLDQSSNSRGKEEHFLKVAKKEEKLTLE